MSHLKMTLLSRRQGTFCDVMRHVGSLVAGVVNGLANQAVGQDLAQFVTPFSIRTLAIDHQRVRIAGEKQVWMFLSSLWLILE